MMISEYIILANEIYIDLDEFYDEFYLEAKVINEAKCVIANNDELIDFYVDGILINVVNEGSNYIFYFNGLEYILTVEDKMITYYDIN